MLKDKDGGRGRAPQHVFKGTACVYKVEMEGKQPELKSNFCVLKIQIQSFLLGFQFKPIQACVNFSKFWR